MPVLSEQYAEWVEAARYPELDVVARAQIVSTPPSSEEVTEPELQALTARSTCPSEGPTSYTTPADLTVMVSKCMSGKTVAAPLSYLARLSLACRHRVKLIMG